jgi:dipeptidyl aminopeptidase/acylaminoacyl peptidase
MECSKTFNAYRHGDSPGRRLRSEDLFQILLIPEAQISPDGSRVCFVQQLFVPGENKYRSHLWIVPTLEGDPRPITEGDQLDHSPAWSRDGRQIAFLSTHSGSLQIWFTPAGGGRASQVTSLRGISGRPVWSPDSRRIAFTILVGKKGIVLENEEPVLTPRERFTAGIRLIGILLFDLGQQL